MEHDHMIKALPPNGTNHPLDVGSLPRGARCRQHFVDAHVTHLSSECIAEDRIAVAQEITWELVKRKGFPQLLSRPLGSWMGGHIEMKNTTPVMGQYQKHVKDLETDSGHGEEIDGDQLLGVILQESAPSLRRWLAGANHVFADAALTDVDAEFEQFTVDAGCTPARVLAAHLADQISDLAGNGWSSGLAVPHLPGPEQAKADTMPGQDCFGLDDGQSRAPFAPDSRQ